MLFDIVAVGLAASYLITAWLHGSIFTEVRAAIDADAVLMWGERRGFGPWRMALLYKFNTWLSCPVCLTPYACLSMYTALYLLGCCGFVPAVIGVLASSAVALYSYKWLKQTYFG